MEFIFVSPCEYLNIVARKLHMLSLATWNLSAFKDADMKTHLVEIMGFGGYRIKQRLT